MPITTCIFDAYGTLFDVAAAAREAAEEPGFETLKTIWPRLAAHWRQKQLEYTWLRATADRHTDFWRVTQDGLDWALDAEGLTDPKVKDRLLALYWELSAYPEVATTLHTLKKAGLATGLLSNGSPDMLEAAVTSAGLRDLIDQSLSVEEVGVFKPHKAVYDLVGTHFGTTPQEVLFVSSNGWDAAGAADYGFTTVWVNRMGAPMDRLYAAPTHIVDDLSHIPHLAGLT